MGSVWLEPFVCKRPDLFDGPLFCIHDSLVDHEFSRAVVPTSLPFPTVSTIPEVAAASTVNIADLFMLLLLFISTISLMIISFFVGKVYRKVHRPVQIIQSRSIIRNAPDVPPASALQRTVSTSTPPENASTSAV
uniref:Uncharacterized protein n=1 Tax=Panagrolaimus davidi TaxID=227884 RepID=A0A914P617_9BILA